MSKNCEASQSKPLTPSVPVSLAETAHCVFDSGQSSGSWKVTCSSSEAQIRSQAQSTPSQGSHAAPVTAICKTEDTKLSIRLARPCCQSLCGDYTSYPQPRCQTLVCHGTTSDCTIRLSWGDSDVLCLLRQSALAQLCDDAERPASALAGNGQGQGHVNDDLLLRGLLVALDHVEVFPAHIPNPARNVQEANSGDLQDTHWPSMEGQLDKHISLITIYMPAPLIAWHSYGILRKTGWCRQEL